MSHLSFVVQRAFQLHFARFIDAEWQFRPIMVLHHEANCLQPEANKTMYFFFSLNNNNCRAAEVGSVFYLIDGFVDGQSQNNSVDWNILQYLDRITSLEVLQLR